jgi:hypothetical protein
MISDYIRDVYRAHRRVKAERLRRMTKRQFLIEDANDFFAGKKTAEESRAYRDKTYRLIDEMSDDEILK